MNKLIVIALISVLTSTAAWAQDAQQQHNAAVWYQRAIEQWNQLTSEQHDLFYNFDSTQLPSPELRAALAQAQPLLRNLEHGSMRSFSDYQLDRSQGIELALPHLRMMRDLARVANADALVRLHDGDSAGAAARIALLYRMGGHVGDDRIIISSLVGQAIFTFADQTAQFGFDRAAFDPTDIAPMLSAVEWLGTKDPFNYVEATLGEQEWIVDWMLREFDGEDGPFRFAQALDSYSFPNNDRIAAIALLDQEEFRAAAEQYRHMLDEVAAIMTLEDPETARAAMQEWDKRLEAGEFGPLAMAMSSTFGSTLERKLRGEQRVAERTELYRSIVAGEIKPVEIANAALWYLRGIEHIEAVEAEKLQSLRDMAHGREARLSDAYPDTLQTLQEAIDIFRNGSLIHRCDFGSLHQKTMVPHLIPPYAAGMHDALCMLRADAMRLLDARDITGATDRLATALRITAHLSSDPEIASAMIAHHHFEHSMTQIEAMLAADILPEHARAELLAAAKRISRSDPFGYFGALTEIRNWMTAQLMRHWTTDAELHDQLQHEMNRIRSFDGDQVLYLLVILDTMIQASESVQATESDTAQTHESLQRLADVFSPVGIEAARDEAIDITPLLMEHDWNVFENRNRPLPVIATARGCSGFADSLRCANSDLHRGLLLLESLGTTPGTKAN